MKKTTLRMGAALLAAILGAAWSACALADVEGSAGWSRATTPGAKEAVGYLVLTNTGDEVRKLMMITSPISDKVTLHRSSVDSNGMARMWPVGMLEIQPGESVRLEPSGVHVMFEDIKHPFKAGDKVPLTMQFDRFEKPITLMLEVRPLVPDPPATSRSAPAH